jgi:polyisoprenoid-binding protein YceI
MSSTTSQTPVADLVAGTWAIDLAHSDVSFSVRHMMVSKVRGHFTRFEGDILVGEDQLASSVAAKIDVSSIDTRDEGRDNHLRSADFFDLEKYPTITYQSTGVRQDGDGFVVHGDLTLHGVTRPVDLQLEVNGVSPDPYGGTRAGFSATTEISRKDFGIDLQMPLDGGGVVVGDKIQISLEVEAVLQTGSAA